MVAKVHAEEVLNASNGHIASVTLPDKQTLTKCEAF